MPHFIEPTFPVALLNESHEKRIAYFSAKGIGHDNIANAFNLAVDNIEIGTQGAIIPIIGPPGVGTTKLGYNLWHHYQRKGQEEFQQAVTQHTRFSVGVHAPSQPGKINRAYWKRLLVGILENGGDVLIDNKICVPSSEFMLTHPAPWGDPSRHDVETLLKCVVNMLKMRKTKALFINQAERMFPDSDPGGCGMSQQLLSDLVVPEKLVFLKFPAQANAR
jgi:hypothetical protein